MMYLLALIIVRSIDEVSTVLPECVEKLIIVPFFAINT